MNHFVFSLLLLHVSLIDCESRVVNVKSKMDRLSSFNAKPLPGGGGEVAAADGGATVAEPRLSIKRFGKKFVEASAPERIQIVDDIAYPEQAKPAMKQGVAFFNLMRDLTMTGFYTTEMGINDLGYIGNQPNVWQGVPEDVLKQYGLTGEE